MVLFNPIPRVLDEKLAHRPAILAIKVNGLAPFIRIAVRKIIRRKPLQVIPVRANMIVNDIQNDSQPKSMRPVHESAEVIRPSVQSGGREQIHSIIAPSEPA